jgi:hypothetical protein
VIQPQTWYPETIMRTALTIFAGLLLTTTGCDQATPTSPVDEPSPSSATLQAAGTDGAFVFRGSVPGVLLMIDFDRERTLIIGHTAAQLADVCSTGIPPEEITEHDVFTPTACSTCCSELYA